MPLLANIPPPPATGFEIGPLDLRLYGLLIAIGAYLGLRMLVTRYQRAGGDPELAERTALVALAVGFLGARLGYVLPRLDHFLANPLEIPAIWQGGLALFGGVTVGVPVCWWYVHRKGGDVARMADAAAPAVPLAQAIGRWGNYFNQELYGRPTDLPWALEVEAHRRVAGFENEATFHPTFLYESLWNLSLVALLLWIDRRRVDGQRWLRRGSLGFLYLAGYGVGRFWTELLRIDTAERYLGLSRNNWVALAVVIVGVAGLVWWERRGPDDEDPLEDAEAGHTDAGDLADADPSAGDELPRDGQDDTAPGGRSTGEPG